MKLCASNIAWSPEHDEEAYRLMQALGFDGLEIAPSRVFSDRPYEKLKEAADFALSLRENYGLIVASMQSAFYGKAGRIAGTSQEYLELQKYIHKAAEFADALNCRNIVFGCPKHRKIDSPEDKTVIEEFLLDAADYAGKFGVVIALEANPENYGTNFVNTTAEAVELVTRLNHPFLKMNLDLGTILTNGENLDYTAKNIRLINHVHISEPELAAVKPSNIHKELANILRISEYSGFVSIEMRTQGFSEVQRVMNYVREVFA